MSKNKNCVIGLTQTQFDTENIVERLGQAGFSNNDISVLFPDSEGRGVLAYEKHTKAGQGAATGAGAGGILGGTLGLLAGIGTLAIPGVGPFIAAGPIMAALSAAALGATIGGFAGTLIGLGIPEYEAKQYENKIKAGNFLISIHVNSDDEKDRACGILIDCDATDISVSKEFTAAGH